MTETLNVTLRTAVGKRYNRRLRHAGAIPAVLYGHGLENLNLAVPTDQMTAAVRHGARLVELSGAASESALIRQLQWDVYGTAILHVDFTRVSADERIEVQVSIELRGEAPGAREGGVIEHLVHEATIECPAGAIPDKLQVSINALKLGDSLTLGAVKLPEGAKLLDDPETVLVHCVHPKAEVEAEPVVGEGAEPELIGRKPAEGEEAEEE